MKIIKNQNLDPSIENKISNNLLTIKDNLKSADEKINKNVILIIFLSLFLLFDSSFSELTIKFITIKNPLIIHTILPLATTFIFRELCTTSYMRERTRRKHKELFFINNNDHTLESYLIPISILTAHEVITEKYNNFWIKIFSFIGNGIDILLLLAISLLPARMIYNNLHNSEHLTLITKVFDITVIASIFTILLWISGIIVFILTETEKATSKTTYTKQLDSESTV